MLHRAKNKWVTAKYGACIFLLFLLMSFIGIQAQNTNAVIQLDSSDFKIGDPIALKLSVDHPFDITIQWQSPLITDSSFTVLSESGIDSIPQKSFLTENRVIMFTTFSYGRLMTPEITIWFHDKNGNADSLKTKRIAINVAIAPVDLEKPYRTITPPLSLPGTDFPWWLLISGGLTSAVILLIILRNRKNKKAVRNNLSESAALPGETIQERLDHLREQMLNRGISNEEFYVRISSAIREFITGRFNYPATEHTSSEIIRFLRNNFADQKLLELLAHDFELADFVKFAKVQPSTEENERVIQTALNFVNQLSTITHESTLSAS